MLLVPYRHYFQSGIVTRAYERGVPVVAERHEYVESLYGPDWPALVDESGSTADWIAAVRTVIDSGAVPEPEIRGDAQRAWREVLDG